MRFLSLSRHATLGTRLLGTGLVIGALVLTGTSTSSAAALPASVLPSAAVPAAAPGTVTTTGIDSLADDAEPVFVTARIPAGLSPTAATTLLTPLVPSTSGTVGSVQVSVKGEVRQTVDPSLPSTVSVPLSATDVVDGQVAIGFTYLSPNATDGFCAVPDAATVSLGAVSVAIEGEPTPPTSLADFFSPALDAISVTIPDAPSDDLRQAGLAAVGSLARVYPSPVSLSLTTVSDAAGAAAVEPVRGRVVTFVDSGTTVTTQLSADANGVPTLTVAGPAAELPAAAAALGSSYLSLADSPTVTGLAQTSVATADLSQTIEDLGAGSQLTLARGGQAQAVVNVSQSSFGGPVGSASVHLVGTHSDIPDSVTATMNVYWNEYLIGSEVLGGTPAFDISLPVPSTRMTASNALRVALSTAPASGECRPESRQIPIELFVDNKASSVDATRGQSLVAGFQRFPQALGSTLPVAFSGALGDAAAVSAAGDIVASLQRNSTAQLAVVVISPAAFVSSEQAGLIVGATSADSDALRAPLRLDAFKAIDSQAVTFGVGATLPYAALESFETDGRNILMLGGWTPDGSASDAADALQVEAAAYALSNDGAWFGLSGDLLVAQPGSDEPVQLSSNAIVPQTAVTSDYNSYALWAIVVILVLLAAATIGEFTRRRRKAKLQRYVDAQLRADEDS